MVTGSAGGAADCAATGTTPTSSAMAAVAAAPRPMLAILNMLDPSSFALAAIHQRQRDRLHRPPLAHARPATLVEIHRDDEDDPDRDQLIEGLNVEDHESIGEHHRDERSQERAADGGDATEQARPTEDDR